MLRKAYLFILFILSFLNVRALEAVSSHAVYYLPDPIYTGNLNPYLEAYWQINPKTIHYNTNAAKGVLARIKTDVFITNDTGHIIKEDHYVYETIPVANADALGNLNILELKRYLVGKGLLRMRLVLTDLNDTTNKMTITDTVLVGELPVNAFYGGIEFVDTFYASEIRTPFRKHGKQYIPLCEGFYDNNRNTLNYYTEIYRLDTVSASEFPLLQTIFISKKVNQDPYPAYQKIDTIRDKTANYYDGSFNIRNLPSGNYYLNFSLGNKAHKTVASRSIFFQRLNTNPITEEMVTRKAAADTGLEDVNFLDLSKTFLSKYTEVQIMAILKMLLPVSDPTGVNTIENFLKKPDDLYMRYFIYNYFLAQNKDKPEVAWKKFSDRVKEVNKLYTSRGKPGYETQRGFMYLRYGEPSEIVPVSSERGALPYEVWQYNVLKEMDGKEKANAVILFYKLSDLDQDYKVLHTNIAGEVHNAGWRSFLYTNSDGGTNMNSRAEQYVGNK